jgi:hypothetical protein
LLSPFLINGLLALLVTGAVRWLIHSVKLGRWIWHEALFDCALYVCVLALLSNVLAFY